MNRAKVIELIEAERERQSDMWSAEHSWGSGDCSSSGVPLIVKSSVLAEECGEVARAILDRDDAGLITELVQVAAVAVAILEGMTE